METLNEYVVRLTAQYGNEVCKIHEEQIRICLRPRPWWLPERVWRWGVARLVVRVVGPVRTLAGEVKP